MRLTSEGLTISLFLRTEPGASTGAHLRTLDSASKGFGQVAVHRLAITMAISRGLKAARYVVLLVLPDGLVSS